MANKLLASNLLIIILQYGMLLLMCFFLYQVIRLIYLDFFRSRQHISEDKLRSGKLKVVSRGFLVRDQAEFLLTETLNIGRSETNDIVINETTVSFEHACISYYHEKYILSDLKSTNGTFHNHMRLQDDTPLSGGDKISIGSTIFQFEE